MMTTHEKGRERERGGEGGAKREGEREGEIFVQYSHSHDTVNYGSGFKTKYVVILIF